MVEFNGVWYRAGGAIINGAEVRTFSDGINLWSLEELRQHVAQQGPKILTPAAEARLAQTEPEQAVELLIVLRHQPAAPISREVFGRVGPEIDDLSRQVRELMRAGQGDAAGGPKGNLLQPGAPVVDLQKKQDLSRQIDDLVRQARREIASRTAEAVGPEQDALAAEVVRLGGQVRVRIVSLSAIGVSIPAGAVGELAAHPLVAQIDVNHAGAPELDNHKHSLGLVTGFWAGGVTGGVYDVGVLDTGVFNQHPALVSHPFQSNFGGGDSNGHGTGMAGILASTDASFTGMAHGCDTIVAAIAGDIFTSMPGMDYIASTGEPENVNYSFGNGTANTTDYGTTDQFFDGVINTHRYMVSKSTGNGGWSATSPTITHPAPAYNLLASANMDDFNTVSRTDDRITSSSSTGPTLGGRKKPDITAPGNNSMSTNRFGGFSNIGGTSSASPHTGGGIVLLYDMGVANVTACKAILLNTTDAMDEKNTSTTSDDVYVPGSHWSKRYGWGYLNLGTAYQRGLDYFADSIPPSPEDQDFRLYAGPMNQYDRATLVWERHVAYNGSTFPTQIETLSDLDLTAWRQSNGNLLAASESRIDNVEQLHSPVNTIVVLKVEAFGTFDPQIAQESFALATPASFEARMGPALDVTFEHPATVAPGANFVMTVTVSNAGDLPAHDVMATVSGLPVVVGSNPASLGSVAAGASVKYDLTLEAPGTTGDVQVTGSAASDAYGETFTGDGQTTVHVGSECYPDCDESGSLDLFDFLCFTNAFNNADPYADCDGDTTLNLFDFLCFTNAFNAGCP